MKKLIAACSVGLLLTLATAAQAGTVWFASTPGVSEAQLLPSSVTPTDAASALLTIDDTAWKPAVACEVLSTWPWQTDTTPPYATWILETYNLDDNWGNSWRWIRHEVTLPSGSYDFSGTIVWTADNAAEVYVNRVPIGLDGQPFGTPNDQMEWQNIKTFTVDGALLHAGENEVLFLVRNYWGPGGLIFEGHFSGLGFVGDFPDVPATYWAYDGVMACAEAGVVTGYPDGLYHPTDEVKRSQMAVFIARALAYGDANVPSGPATATFPDVPATGYGENGTQSYWAYRYIEYCAAHGIAGGYPDGTYRPEDVVNRGQMAIYVARAKAGSDAAVPPAGAVPVFPDVPGSDNAWAWCRKYVEYCAAQGIVKGYPDGTYRPADTVTRDQMAVYVARAFGL